MIIDAPMHRALARHGGAAVRLPLDTPRPIADHRTLIGGCAVYVACDTNDRVMYVGSVYRPGNASGISRRIAEHLRDPLKALRWARLWTLVVDDQQSIEWVRRYEGIVAAELPPTWNDRVPALF